MHAPRHHGICTAPFPLPTFFPVVALDLAARSTSPRRVQTTNIAAYTSFMLGGFVS